MLFIHDTHTQTFEDTFHPLPRHDSIFSRDLLFSTSPLPCYSSPCTTPYMRVTLIWIIFSYSDINYLLLFLDENVCISYFLSYIWEWMVVMLVISDKCSCFCKYTPLFSFIKEIINMVILILEMFESLQIQIWLLVSDESVLYFPTC